MSADEKMNTAPSTEGRKVAFIGGPEAGRARIIPESHGDLVMGSCDYLYRIWPVKMSGDPRTLHFAFAANEHPIKMMYKLWEEYSIAAQIRGGDYTHIKRMGQDIKTRT